MKKKLLSLMAFVCAVVMLSSCNKDDKEIVDPVVGKYTLVTKTVTDEFGQENVQVDMYCAIKSASGKVPMMGADASTETAASFFSLTVGSYVSALQSFTFEPDGTISLSFMKDDKLVTIPDGVILKKGDLTYSQDASKIYIAVNKNLLSINPSMGAAIALIPGVIDNGTSYSLPLLYTKNGNKLKIYVTKEMMLPFTDLIAPMMTEPMIKMGFDAFVGVLKACDSFELGINLETK